MSKAKITKKGGYKCAPNGHTVETFPEGGIVTGQVAEWALADKAASRMMEKKPRSNKNQGAAPENKKAE